MSGIFFISGFFLHNDNACCGICWEMNAAQNLAQIAECRPVLQQNRKKATSEKPAAVIAMKKEKDRLFIKTSIGLLRSIKPLNG